MVCRYEVSCRTSLRWCKIRGYKFLSKNQVNTYTYWLDNIRDWCISRQLWWGHRIPAYYYGEDVFVGLDKEEIDAKAKSKFGADFDISLLRQDEDVLDTWFSSWLWPITVFNGFDDEEQYNYYVPTSVLVTGWDIIFLWVARMIMANYEWKQENPLMTFISRVWFGISNAVK